MRPGRHPPEFVEKVCKLLADGLSSSKVAAVVGGISRNGVIGVAHRHGHKFPFWRVRRTHAQGRPRAPKKLAPPKIRVTRGDIVASLPNLPISAPAETDIARMAFADREMTKHCGWIIGDASPAMCCGADIVPGLPYCADHARRAYNAAQVAIRSPGRSTHTFQRGKAKEVAV